MYAALSYANSYFETERLNSAIWFMADPNNQIKALKTATRYIDRLKFIGEKTDEEQVEQFPRDGDTVVPDDIMKACCEIAFALIDGRDIEVEQENLDMVSQGYGTLRSTYDRSIKPAHVLAGIPSIVAWRYLLPYMCDTRDMIVTRV